MTVFRNTFSEREKTRLRERGRARRLCALQDRSIRQDQIPGGGPQRLDRGVRVGPKAVLQVHGVQVVPEPAAQAAARRLGHRRRDAHESALRLGDRLSRHRSRLGQRVRHLHTAHESGRHVHHAAHHRGLAQQSRHAFASLLQQRGRLRGHEWQDDQEYCAAVGRVALLGCLHIQWANHGLGQ